MAYRDFLSARNRNNSLYECRRNVRTILTKQQQQQQQVSNNAQNNTLSYAQTVTAYLLMQQATKIITARI
jgi:hypothetical protein